MPAYELLVITGPNEGQACLLQGDEVTIGRDPTCELSFDDGTLSRKHAKIVLHPDSLALEDLGSANGVLVNGVRVKKRDLKVDDQITLGNVELRLCQVPDTAGSLEKSSPSDTSPEKSNSQDQTTELQLQTGQDEEPASVMSITQTLSSSILMDLLSRSHHSLSTMYRVIRIASSILDLDVVLSKILDEIFANVKAERAFILLIDSSSDRLEVKASRWQDKQGHEHQVSISQNIISHVLEKKESVLVADAMSDSKFSLADSVMLHNIRSAMCSPLRGRTRIVGIIHADTTAAKKFSQEDLMLLDAIGNAAGIAVENAQFYWEKVQNERLAAVGQAISGLSHYIKNILAAMDTSHAMVERAVASEDLAVISRVWKILRRSNQRIGNLVLDMLAYSKERQPETQPCQLNGLCREVAELLYDRMQAKSGKLHLDLDQQLPQIQADPQGIHRCLLNLLSNAVDALEQDKGEVTISTRNHQESRVMLIVEDNGCGISEEVCPRIFEVFFSTKGSQGTGLGLAVTKKIVEEHGGSIEVQSNPGQGTKFTIQLPIKKTADG